MALVMVLSLAPVALATDPPAPSGTDDMKWTGGSSSDESHTHSRNSYLKTDATCAAAGSEVWTCTCGATITKPIDKLTTHTPSSTYTQITESSQTKHYKACTVCGAKIENTEAACAAASTAVYKPSGNGHKTECDTCENVFGSEIAHTANTEWKKNDSKHWHTCTACNAKIASTEADHLPETWTTTASGHSGTCKDCGQAIAVTKHTFENGKCTVCNYEDPSKDCTITISYGEATISEGEEYQLYVTVKDASGATISNPSVTWSSSNTSKATVSSTGLVKGVDAGTVTITAKCTPVTGGSEISATTKITVTDVDLPVYATVSSNYILGEVDDNSRYSVWEKIERLLTTNEVLDYVEFDDVKSEYGDLSVTKGVRCYEDDFYDIEFVPETKGTAEFRFTAYVYSSKSSSKSYPQSGLLSIDVKDTVATSKGDISYTAALGENVYFDVSAFEDFYEDEYKNGYLEYVTFGSSSSNGTLYGDDGRRASGDYYVEPGRNRKSLDGVYFEPKSTMKKATTVNISFTAYGTTRNSSGEGKVEGTVSIVYLNDSASDISYSTTNGSVTLDPQDFIDAYKEATGKTASSSTNLTIEFQNVPSIGTLTYTNGSRKTTLTSKNVKNNRYTTKSSGTYRLEQLTYTGTSGKDTIDYIAYSGGTAQFSGKVVFNGSAAIPTNLSIPMTCTSSYGVNMNSGSFTSANATAMAKCSIIRFDRPTGGGSLTYAGTSAVGVSIPFSLVGMVTYTPASGFNGTDRILFVAQDASGNTVASGQVNVTVSGNSGSGNNNTGSGTPISKMTDVPATAWYRTELSDLMNKGIIAGRTPTSFAPDGTVTYGEALKMVLRAAGYPAQSEPTGNNWAINYKNLAVSNGIIEDSIDLNANITRDKMVEVAAKALKINASTASSPFTDSSNPYAIALYNTYYSGSKGIIGGNPDGTFKGGDTLNRAEMCAIVWRMNTYYAIRYSSVMPDGI